MYWRRVANIVILIVARGSGVAIRALHGGGVVEFAGFGSEMWMMSSKV